VEYSCTQITMKSAMSELLGVIDFALPFSVHIGVNARVKLGTLYRCHTLLTHCPWYLMIVLKKY
jgi:hypothetical protein